MDGMPKTASEAAALKTLWKMAAEGVAAGYPACCIQQYLENKVAGLAPEGQRIHTTGYRHVTEDFVPCDYHCQLAIAEGGFGAKIATAKAEIKKTPPRTGDDVVVQLEKGRGYSIVAMGFIPGTKNVADGDPFDVILADKRGGQGGRFRAKIVGVIKDPQGNHKWVATTNGQLPSKKDMQSLRGYRAARQEFIGKKMPIKIPGVKDKQVKVANHIAGMVRAVCESCGYETELVPGWQQLASIVARDGGQVDYENVNFVASCPGCGLPLEADDGAGRPMTEPPEAFEPEDHGNE